MICADHQMINLIAASIYKYLSIGITILAKSTSMIYHITASEWPRALVLPLRMPCSVRTNMALGARQAGRRRPGSVVHLDGRAL